MNAHDTAPANPVLVEVMRGDTIESFHRGAIAVVDASGTAILARGEVERPIFPRSAVKMIQALPLLETGAADHFHLSEREIALACASHSGEPGHVEAVGHWMERLNIPLQALACGSAYPLDDKSARERASPALPSALHNNCSGKHAGFLTTARYLGIDPHDYVHRDHPVQQGVTAALSEITSCDLDAAPCGIDGCGIPAYAIPLRRLAQGMARLASPHLHGPERAAAAQRVIKAVEHQPWFIGGTGRLDTLAIEAGGGRFVVKMGAEGVHVALAPDAGVGVALKIDDGSRRAADLVMAGILRLLGWIDTAQFDLLARGSLVNARGETVGRLCLASLA
ncbi:MAG TPA: asparaginase [Xanthobacteraceae bacterium]|jgi:L-asparaginase II